MNTTATDTTTHRIVIHPIDRTGSYRVTDRDTGQEWLAKTKTPACAAARVLADCGASANDRLEMFREGRDTPDLTGSIGFFAGRSVSEGERHGPKFVSFVAFDRSRIAALAA